MFLRNILLSQGSTVVTPPPPSTLRNTLGLNGSSEYATIAADASITMGDGSRSFSCWADLNAVSSTLFQFGNISNGHGFVDFAYDAVNKLQARAFAESGTFSNQRRYTTDNTISTGVHHLAVVFNTWGVYDIYVDGVAQAVTANNTGSPGTHTGTYTMNLGAYPDASVYLTGSLSAPMLFDKNLSAAEVTAIYNSGVGIQPADFSGHGNATVAALYSNMMFGIPFNDGEANEEQDGSSNTNNSTLQGSPVYDGTQQLFED
tara:strand:- start:46 stop:825 length:780 start_codon:yes stop_codon:yes gene_type:complete